MALCEICGSFLIANDAAERTQSHVTGKQHIGYGMVRDFLEEHKVSSTSQQSISTPFFFFDPRASPALTFVWIKTKNFSENPLELSPLFDSNPYQIEFD